MRTMKRFAVPICAVFALGTTGCGNATGTNGTASVSVLLTDMPGNVAHVWVDITEIELIGSDKVMLRNTPTGLVDLVSLEGTTLTIVDEMTVPEGTFTQLRLVLGGAVLETEDGAVFVKDGAEHPDGDAATGVLNCPSCTPSGLKIKLPDGNVKVEAEAIVLLVDFDAAQSFGHDAADSNQWVMHPVIHASDFQLTGAVGGTVSLAGADTPDTSDDVTIPMCDGQARSVEDFVPVAIDSGDPTVMKTGTVAADGSYRILFLDPGTYDMDFEAEIQFAAEKLIFTAIPTPAQASVTSGGLAPVDYVIDSAMCTP